MDSSFWDLTTDTKGAGPSREEAAKALNKLLNRKDLGFFKTQYIEDSLKAVNAQKSFLDSVDKLVVIGLGSSLGTKAIAEMLRPGDWHNQLVFLDNVDSLTLDRFLEGIDQPEKWGWVICSKSGSTIEVTSLYDVCHQAILAKHNFSIAKKTIVVTENKKSPIFDFAIENKCPILEMPESIGGRFSAFTSIGLLPLAFLGLKIEDFKKGFDQTLANPEIVIELVSFLKECQAKGR